MWSLFGVKILIKDPYPKTNVTQSGPKNNFRSLLQVFFLHTRSKTETASVLIYVGAQNIFWNCIIL